MKIDSHEETIKCTECGKVQIAEVVHTCPWNTYIHECEGCGYTIMESEWNTVADIQVCRNFLSKGTIDTKYTKCVICGKYKWMH